MKYDFETVVRRFGVGSGKWEEMKKYPGLPEDAVPFSVADMELTIMPEVTQGLKSFIDETVLGYAGPTPDYLEAVCAWMKRRHSWDVRPEWIVGTPGVVNAFFAAVRTFTQPGEGVLLMTPAYYPMYMACERNERRIVRSSLIERGGRYEIDFDDFEAKAKEPDVKLLLLCSPHNPTGRVWTEEELRRIGAICLENGVVVCSDEIHHDLVMPGYRHTVFASLGEDFAQNSVTCTAPSKTFNLAGLQTSNIVIPNDTLREKYLTELRRVDGNPKCNILGMEACRLAYTHGDEWLDQLILLVDENRRTIEDFVKRELPAVRVCPHEGTYLLWLDFRALGIESHELARMLREEAYLFFDEGYLFGPEGDGFERWNLACPTHCITAALDRLKKALDRHL